MAQGRPGEDRWWRPRLGSKFYPVYFKGRRPSSLVFMQLGGARLCGYKGSDTQHENTMPLLAQSSRRSILWKQNLRSALVSYMVTVSLSTLLVTRAEPRFGEPAPPRPGLSQWGGGGFRQHLRE